MPLTKAPNLDGLFASPAFWRGRAQLRLDVARSLHPTEWSEQLRHYRVAADHERSAQLLEVAAAPRPQPTTPELEPPLAYFRPRLVDGDDAA